MLLKSMLEEASLQVQLIKMIQFWLGNYRQENGLTFLEKKDLKPEKLQDVIPYLTLSEFISENEMRIRLSGTEVDKLSSGNLRGRNLINIIPAPKRNDYAKFMSMLNKYTFGYISKRIKTSELGQKTILKTLYLPLLQQDTGQRFMVSVYQITHESVTLNGNEVIDLFAKNEKYALQLLDVGNGLPAFDDDLQKSLNLLV